MFNLACNSDLDELAPEEIELIELYRRMETETQKVILKHAKDMLDLQKLYKSK